MVSTAALPPGQRRGVWEPLPRFIYGYAVHSLSPSGRRDTRLSSRTRISTFTDASGDENLVHRDVVFAHLWPHLDGRLPRPLAAVILTAAAIAASGVLYMLVERPAERWLRARGPEEAVTA